MFASSPLGENSQGLDPSEGSAIPAYAASISSTPAKSKLSSRENVVSYVTQWAERMPDTPALKVGEHVLSYRNLEIKSREIAKQLKLMGVSRETAVGVYAERSIGLAVAALGVMRAGGAYLPLDPSHPRERLTYQLADAQAKAVIVVENESTPRDLDLPIPVIRCSFSGSIDLPLDAECALTPPAEEDLAYVIYTSGSTGRPKGVEITHALASRASPDPGRWPLPGTPTAAFLSPSLTNIVPSFLNAFSVRLGAADPNFASPGLRMADHKARALTVRALY